MEHNPQIVSGDIQHFADLLTFQTVNFSQRERSGGALWKRRQTVIEYSPEIAPLNQFRGRGLPISRRMIGIPMTGPLSRNPEQFSVLRCFLDVFTDWCFSRYSTEVIRYFVLQDTDEPCPFRPTSLEVFVCFNGSEKSLLKHIFGRSLIAQSENC